MLVQRLKQGERGRFDSGAKGTAKKRLGTRDRIVEKSKRGFRDALHSLGTGKRTRLTRLEARVLALWGIDVENSEFRKARSRLRFQLGQSDKFRAGLVRSGDRRPGPGLCAHRHQ